MKKVSITNDYLRHLMVAKTFSLSKNTQKPLNHESLPTPMLSKSSFGKEFSNTNSDITKNVLHRENEQSTKIKVKPTLHSELLTKVKEISKNNKIIENNEILFEENEKIELTIKRLKFVKMRLCDKKST